MQIISRLILIIMIVCSHSLGAMNEGSDLALVPFDPKVHGERARAIFSKAFNSVPPHLSRQPSPDDMIKIAILLVNKSVEGIVVYQDIDEVRFIDYVAVDETKRFKGYGRSLIAMLGQQAKTKGLKSMKLIAKNSKNIEIFKKMGFQQDSTVSKAVDNAFMIKNL
jgi:GNAT superfamily N-acetyltransferase